MSARIVAACYWVGMTGLTIGTFAAPAWRAQLWGCVGLLSAAGIATGVIRHRPRRVWPWALMAGGILTSTAGDVIYFVLRDPASTARLSSGFT